MIWFNGDYQLFLFISTNIDDIFVLMILYSQVNDKMKKKLYCDWTISWH